MNFEHPSQRLKPKFLREIKSEALLVFCKQLLMLNTDGLVIKAIFSEERFHKEADHIRKSIRKLTEQLGTHVIDQQYLDYLILNHRKKNLHNIFTRELPLIYYSDVLFQTLKKQMKNKQKWVPEFLVFSLLSEWFIEENNSMQLFSFIKQYQYLEILSMYEKAALESDDKTKFTIKDMYNLSSSLVSNLKKAKFQNFLKV
jgi:hypothetical protein